MSSTFENFRSLHAPGALLVLPNAWDAKSAVTFEGAGSPAVATSSYAVAGALGYEDGERMSFDEYLFVIRRILSAVRVPVSVDMEMGYGSTDEEIFQHILTLTDLGIVGINIEDSKIDASGRGLRDAKIFADTVRYVRRRLAENALDLFINVRCDAYLLDVANKREETKLRSALYEAAGADGIFLPCISEEEDILQAVRGTRLPVNVMQVPGLPDAKRLRLLGVRRLTMGPYLYSETYSALEKLSQTIIHE